ncbi:MAG: 4Fe-4S binding protein [Candidatus Omnitrophica bacterium]|nr:4Fe-4S binding protein [Candidatus Omnitrophota bacterium]MBU1047315.1 4Fe-4S binding protein [Candidatus Omnitrophota bacterium]MBU1630421.1 4Fe-4S binding protein [Candidatus Omnitrophota bacterium]MBU1766480.1 4Fe-4S binding protein [Candidatus Omnitrophota bacterium]MBU1889100.1 4Fe-4S binding protein [Candidatus Omnitrophota bacterium]
MKLPKLRELKEAVKALIAGPYTSKFPKELHKPHPNFRGQPKYNQDRCVGCLACVEVCPVGALDYKDSKGTNPKRTLIHYTDTCIFCSQCESACIADHEGIKLSNDWELSFFDREKESFETIEKELQLCEICGEVIACRDHLKWISEKLGELTYSNPTLYLSRLKALGIADENIVSALKDQGRSDRVKILCARCRRETTLTTK